MKELYIQITIGAVFLFHVLFSWKGFKDKVFESKYLFKVGPIFLNREYFRLITAGFLHANWIHLGLNMYGLFIFSPAIIKQTSIIFFLFIYIISVIGGNLFTLLIHRNHEDYSALGASGGVFGLIFSFIVLSPRTPLGLIFVPIYIPGWIFGILLIAGTIYGIKKQKGNICHEGHFGGGIIGLVIALIFYPNSILKYPLQISLLLAPSLVFIALVIFKPHIFLLQGSTKNKLTVDEKFNLDKNQQEKELNRILDKINKVGFENLSQKEKTKLNNLSK